MAKQIEEMNLGTWFFFLTMENSSNNIPVCAKMKPKWNPVPIIVLAGYSPWGRKSRT